MGSMKTSDATRRIKWLSAIFLFISALILSRFADMQLFESEGYVKKQAPSLKTLAFIPQERGEVFLADRFGNLMPLAVNRSTFVVYAEPRNVARAEETAQALAEALSLPYPEVLQKVAKPGDPYEVIANRVSEDKARRVNELALPGVGTEREAGRYYPLEASAAHLSGFVGVQNDDPVGQYGVEGFYEESLKKEGGTLKELVLSVDPQIQFKIEEALAGVVIKFQAQGGSVIVMEPSSGRILGLANYPGFNPNEYAKVEHISVFANPAISGQFELGSVFKPVTMAAALNEKAVTPDTTYTDTGEVRFGSYVIRNFDGKSHGKPTMTQVLEQSLNTGIVFAQQQIPKSAFKKYVEQFGFGTRSGVDIQGEAPGNLVNLAKEKDLEYANAAFGQGITMTPLQMLASVSAIANKGLLMTPHVVDKKVYRDDSTELVEIPPVRQVISEETANTLTTMLVSTVENGYDKAKVPGYFIAGKTGTAQIPNEGAKGYSDDTLHAFVGFAPAYHPRFAVFVKIDKPQGVRFASQSLAPVFSHIMQYLLTYYEVPPDFK